MRNKPSRNRRVASFGRKENLMMPIPFNRPYMHPQALVYMRQAYENGHLSGDGPFTKKCHAWLEAAIGCKKALLTHSGTAALEMAAILAGIGPGDEIIMPSFTFVSTANAFVLRGGVPVFVDIREDTLNIDETKIEAAITPKTKAIVAMHYAGVGCEMDPIISLARKRDLLVIEDAAHAVLSGYKKKPLGSFGHLAVLSFHETKTLSSGEGGALLINDPRFVKRAEIIREKGTNRSQFFRGDAEKYVWLDIGSSYLPSDLIAALLWSQFEASDQILQKRRRIWDHYYAAFSDLEKMKKIRRPVIPDICDHSAHMFYLLTQNLKQRTRLLESIKRKGIMGTFHYVPLHNSPAGKRFGRVSGCMDVTISVSERLARLPLWIGVENSLEEIITAVRHSILQIEKTPVLKK